MPDAQHTTRDNRTKDLTGQNFGRLIVVRFLEYRHTHGKRQKKRPYWECSCACGGACKVRADSLLSNAIRSCGCLLKETTRLRFTKHGESARDHRSAEYGIWAGMIQRCYRKTHKHYRHYGGRGIAVCDGWRHDFAQFLNDMGRRPSPKHKLERKNNSTGYEKNNCVWATQAEQMRNTRRNHLITFNGTTLCMTDWAHTLHLTPASLLKRLKYWSPEKALTTLNMSRRTLTAQTQ